MGGEQHLGNEGVPSADLSYGRELFLHMFQDSSPFASLGYSAPQIEEARKALKQLENVEGRTSSPLQVTFDDDRFYSSSVQLSYEGKDLEKNLWHLSAQRDIYRMIMSQLPPDASEEEIKQKKLQALFLGAGSVKIKTFRENENLLAAVSMFPEDADTADIQTVIKGVNDGWHGFGTDAGMLHKPTLWNKLLEKTGRNRFGSTYRAAWLDDQSKRDLVIEYTNPHVQKMAKLSKKMGETDEQSTEESKLQVWRKLPEQELDGQKWIPFGLKLNQSASQAMAAFESQPVATGRLSFNFNQ